MQQWIKISTGKQRNGDRVQTPPAFVRLPPPTIPRLNHRHAIYFLLLFTLFLFYFLLPPGAVATIGVVAAWVLYFESQHEPHGCEPRAYLKVCLPQQGLRMKNLTLVFDYFLCVSCVCGRTKILLTQPLRLHSRGY